MMGATDVLLALGARANVEAALLSRGLSFKLRREASEELLGVWDLSEVADTPASALDEAQRERLRSARLVAAHRATTRPSERS